MPHSDQSETTTYRILNPLEHDASRAHLCALAVMAKAPRPGKVKTRLSPPLTPDQAATLNISFLQDTTQNIAEVCAAHPPTAKDEIVIRSGPRDPLLASQTTPPRAAGLISYTPIGDESAFNTLLPPNFALVPQRGDTFGERLLAAAHDILALGYGSVCLIDSDSPTVPATAFHLAIEALHAPGDNKNRIVLGPSNDGGYYLIGLTQPHPEPFTNITWSTPTVFAETTARCWDANLEVVLLPLWYDVDDKATLQILTAELLESTPPAFTTTPGYPAPHTRAFLKNLQQGTAR